MALECYRTDAGLPERLERSEIETRRFGYEIGRFECASTDGFEARDLRALFLDSPLDLLIVRLPVAAFDWAARLRHRDLAVIQTDTLVYFQKDLVANPPAPLDGPWRMARQSDRAHFESMVAATFDHYPNHYAADPVFDLEAVKAGYVEWAMSYLDESVPNQCIVVRVDDNDEIISFLTLRSNERPEVVLGGVAPAARGDRAYVKTLAVAEQYFVDNGIDNCVISTQTTNGTVIRHWVRTGYQYEAAFNTLHLLKGRALHALDEAVGFDAQLTNAAR